MQQRKRAGAGARRVFREYADGRTRTGTACATAPSRQRVYQFHHIGTERKTASFLREIGLLRGFQRGQLRQVFILLFGNGLLFHRGNLLDSIQQAFLGPGLADAGKDEAGGKEQRGEDCRDARKKVRRSPRTENRPGRARTESGARFRAFSALKQHKNNNQGSDKHMRCQEQLL